MASVRTLQRSFGGGVISAEMFGRIDDAKYQSGVAVMRNFVALPQGAAQNRAGLRFVDAARPGGRVFLIPFSFSVTQTMVIAIGGGAIRFYTNGATLMARDGQTPYEIAAPYDEADVMDIHYAQSADVLTLVHPKYAPRELRRLGPSNWTLSVIAFTQTLAAPTGVAAAASGGEDQGTQYTYRYVVTAINDANESVASSVATVNGNLFETGRINTISWNAVSGAKRYYVYKYQGGLYGYIGATDTLSIVDNNIAADMSKTPPIYDSVFGSAGNYPAAVSYFEQRRVFAGTDSEPQTFWMTKSGTESVMSYSMPTRDDDRIKARIAAREANAIFHAVPLSRMIFLTASAEWAVWSVNSDAITPATVSARPQSYVGANGVQPFIVNNTLIYCAFRGGHVRELGYNYQQNGFVSGDLSLRATHLFDGMTITDMAFSKAPYQILWFISSNGRLLGLTYIPEQEIGAWHEHVTDGVFESCAVVAEGLEDVLYVVVRRHIDGQDVRYIECLHTRAFAAQEEAFFVDSGLTYQGEPTVALGGLEHLEGKEVAILADGAVHPRRVVRGGGVTLDEAARTVHVGLPIVAQMQTLPFAAQIDNAYGQGRIKNVNKAWLRVLASGGIFTGPDEEHLVEAKQRTSEPYGSPPRLKTGEVDITNLPSWTDGGQVFIRQADPLPLTVLSITLELTMGGG